MREPTKKEVAWCNKLRRLIKKMPSTISLFADGNLFAVDKEELNNYDNIDEFWSLNMIIYYDGRLTREYLN